MRVSIRKSPHLGEKEIDPMFVGRSISTTLAALPSHIIVFMAFSLKKWDIRLPDNFSIAEFIATLNTR